MLHFLKISSLETTFQNSLRANYENFDRIEDRKSAVTFYAVNCRTSHTHQSIEKFSRNRFSLLSSSSPTEPMCFLPFFFFKLNFKKNLWFFKKIVGPKITSKAIWTWSKRQILYIFGILKISNFLGIHSNPHPQTTLPLNNLTLKHPHPKTPSP